MKTVFKLLSAGMLIASVMFLSIPNNRVLASGESHQKACVFTVTTPDHAEVDCKNTGTTCTTVMNCLKIGGSIQ
jgi:hypothetical protein